MGMEVDGEDLYLYGYTGENNDFFYQHNETFNYRYRSPKKYVRDFLVNEGKKYFVLLLSGKTQKSIKILPEAP